MKGRGIMGLWVMDWVVQVREACSEGCLFGIINCGRKGKAGLGRECF